MLWRIPLILLALAVSMSGALAQSRIDQLGAAAALSNTDKIPLCQGCGPGTPAVAATGTQLGTFIGQNAVTSIATGCQATGGTITTTGTISTKLVVNNTYTSSQTLASGDACNITLLNAATAQTLTLNNWSSGNYGTIINKGAGTWTLSAGTGSINSGCTSIAQNASADIQFDGTNWNIACGAGSGGTVTINGVNCTVNSSCNVTQCLGAPMLPNASGKWIAPWSYGGGSASGAQSAGYIYFMPICIGAPVTIEAIDVRTQTQCAGSGSCTATWGVGLFSTGNGGTNPAANRPYQLLAYGFSSAQATNNQTVSFTNCNAVSGVSSCAQTPAVSVLTPGWYWLAFNYPDATMVETQVQANGVGINICSVIAANAVNDCANANFIYGITTTGSQGSFASSYTSSTTFSEVTSINGGAWMQYEILSQP